MINPMASKYLDVADPSTGVFVLNPEPERSLLATVFTVDPLKNALTTGPSIDPKVVETEKRNSFLMLSAVAIFALYVFYKGDD
jgi:hypothetical protein